MGLLSSMPEDDRRKLRNILIVMGVIAVPVIIASIFSEIETNRMREQLQPWAAMARESAMGQPQPADDLDPAGGYTKGRILPVDWRRREPDLIYFRLAETLRSAKPEDVGTIIWLVPGEKEVGEYEGGSKAYVHTVRVTVIDKARNVVVARKEVSGGPPPEKVKKGTPGYGSYPTEEVLQYIFGLPRRQ